MREYRARKREAAGKLDAPAVKFPDDPATAISKWSKEVLKVPAGHPLAGQPMVLPEYGVDFIKDMLSHRESLLCLARKNAKSAIVAVYLLARLVGPVRVKGYRAGVVSVTKEKAGELRRQVEEIAEASNLLEQIKFLRSPAPGRIVGPLGGTVDILSADKSSGHASGFDDSIIDELGLLDERHRDLVNGMRTAISARDGRFLALSIFGFGPFVPEIIERREDPAVAVHLYQAPEGSALDDGEAWHKANPGLKAGIKSLSYMQDESRRVLSTTGGPDQSSFRAMEMNLPATPGAELIVPFSEWEACLGDAPPREGRVWCGFDAGSSASMTAWATLWESGRLETWAALPGTPTALQRGKADGVGDLYVQMQEAGELRIYDGRVTPIRPCLAELKLRLDGEEVAGLGFDRHRKAEVVGAMEAENMRWSVFPRGTGAGSFADGTADIRSFQKAVLGRTIFPVTPIGITSAISGSRLRYDNAGNPALDKLKKSARIDLLQATIIATGLRALSLLEAKRRPLRLYRVNG